MARAPKTFRQIRLGVSSIVMSTGTVFRPNRRRWPVPIAALVWSVANHVAHHMFCQVARMKIEQREPNCVTEKEPVSSYSKGRNSCVAGRGNALIQLVATHAS